MSIIYRKRIITLKEFVFSIHRYLNYRFIKSRTLGYLDIKLAEKIRLIISEINECKYCYHSHLIVSVYLNVKKSEIITLDNIYSLNQESIEWLALNFARLYLFKLNNVQSIESLENASVRLQQKLNLNQIEKIKTIVYVMNFNNRSMNTIEMLIGSLSGKVKPSEDISRLESILMLLLVSIIAFPRIIRLNIMRIRNKIKKIKR